MAEQRISTRSRLFWLGSRLLVVLVLLAVLVFFAPAAIVKTGLWKSILASATPELAHQLDVGSLKLRWLSPIEFHDVVVKDAGGQTLAQLPVVRGTKSLLQIALNSRDLGTFEVDDPKVAVVLRRDGSNVEDLLAKLPKSQSKA